MFALRSVCVPSDEVGRHIEHVLIQFFIPALSLFLVFFYLLVPFTCSKDLLCYFLLFVFCFAFFQLHFRFLM